jgi:hypothetical protein
MTHNGTVTYSSIAFFRPWKSLKANVEISSVIFNSKYREIKYKGFEVFAAVTIKNAVSWDITSYGSCKN